MAELALDVDRRLALLEQETREGVAEAVGREVRGQFCASQQAAENAVEVVLVQWGALLRAEHPGRHLPPAFLQRLRLPGQLMASQGVGELLAHVHGAAVATLRRVETAVREGAHHPNLLAGKVEVRPLQREGLTQAQARASEAEEEWKVTALMGSRIGSHGRTQKRCELLAGECLDLVLTGRRDGHESQIASELVGGIRHQHTVVDRRVQHRPQGRVDDPDRGARQSARQLLCEERLDLPALELAELLRPDERQQMYAERPGI